MRDVDHITGGSDVVGGRPWVGYSRMNREFQPGLAAASRSLVIRL